MSKFNFPFISETKELSNLRKEVRKFISEALINKEFDFDYLKLEYFSFNFPFILIFFFTLKDFKHFDYLFVFFAGLLNDTVIGLPLGISSLSYTLICIATAYIRNITIRPSPMKDWFYFLFIISLINSINFTVLFISFFFFSQTFLLSEQTVPIFIARSVSLSSALSALSNNLNSARDVNIL